MAPSDTAAAKRQGKEPAPDLTANRTKAQKHMIRIMSTRGGKGFRRLRSAETSLAPYKTGDARPPSGERRAS
ncbi:hypothetical protein GCM10009867_21890 [Pedococcus aerophilus]|uniref:Uncharacterized protein n=1 Tax=Pedococcus aerophilus TaxID=436356 RepID=A0ABN3UPL1_9MICO